MYADSPGLLALLPSANCANIDRTNQYPPSYLISTYLPRVTACSYSLSERQDLSSGILWEHPPCMYCIHVVELDFVLELRAVRSSSAHTGNKVQRKYVLLLHKNQSSSGLSLPNAVWAATPPLLQNDLAIEYRSIGLQPMHCSAWQGKNWSTGRDSRFLFLCIPFPRPCKYWELYGTDLSNWWWLVPRG